MKILVANGVNLDLLGSREPKVYGAATLPAIEAELNRVAPALAKLFGLGPVTLTFFQSNTEAEFLAALDGDHDGALLNPGAWTHTSLALGDRLAAHAKPFVEVHLSNLASRETFRQHSYAAPHAQGIVQGLKVGSYVAGLAGLLHHLAAKPKA